MNREYIAKNLCVQKDVEDNCCQGSCHLKEELEEDEKKEEAPAAPLKEVKEFQIFCQQIAAVQFNVNPIEKEFIPFLVSKPSSSSLPIFHPPKV